MTHWIGNPDPDNYYGFIYIITNKTNGKKYIGKKTYWFTSRVLQKGKKRRKVVRRGSDWKTYTGSSRELNDDIASLGMHNFEFRIKCQCQTKSSLYYAEVELLVTSGALWQKDNDGNRTFYNAQIPAVKFLPKRDCVCEY